MIVERTGQPRARRVAIRAQNFGSKSEGMDRAVLVGQADVVVHEVIRSLSGSSI
jgi:hypothetical protein